jgi:hypothetical protein
MYEQTIDNILQTDKNTNEIYLGTFAFNEKPAIRNYPTCFILNTKPRSMEGEHWLAFYFDKSKTCYFFDSYGNKPCFFKLQSYITKNSKNCFYNSKRLQGFEPYCGLYSIFFVLFAVHEKLDDFFSVFTDNYKKNDAFFTKNLK